MGGDLSQEAYEELVNHSTDIIIVVDESGTITYESPSVERITGYAPEERVGDNVFDHVHPEDQRTVRETFSEVLAASEPRVLGAEFRYRHKEEGWVWLESRGSTETADAIDGFVVSLRDITERKESERQLRAERDRLDRFASVVSHDLRNPLNVLEGRLELAREDCDSEHLDAMDRSLDRVNELIDDLLTMAREGETDPLLAPVDLRATAERCWGHVATNEATLVVETERTIMAVESQLDQVLENLFRNAVEHGGDAVTITVGDLEDGFYVADDGSGVPVEARDSVFEYGVSTTDEGTGFGLGIVAEIADHHGWTATMATAEAGGARVEIRGVTVA